MYKLTIPSLSTLFDYVPTATSIKYDAYEFLFPDDNQGKQIIQELEQDLKLVASPSKNALYREGRKVIFLTKIEPLESSGPVV